MQVKPNPVIYIDIHTHSNKSAPGTIAIRNILADFDAIPTAGWYSAGLHPWYLKADQANHPDGLIKAAHTSNVLAIGECGLDTLCITPAEIQRTIFIRQIELAVSVGKPLVIHCVRAFDEIMAILKKLRVSIPVIFHGFNRSDVQAARIIADGYMLSFGRHLLKATVAEVFRKLPTDRVFLETDDSDIPIEEIYAAAARIRGTDIDDIATRINLNVKHIFGPFTDLI
jgi:TatD DNase family protein